MTARVRLTQLLLAGACVSAFGTAYAQDPAPDGTVETTVTTTTSQTADDAEEITVTATRRATKIQATPIAITAVGQKAIENAGVRETQSLTQVVPGTVLPAVGIVGLGDRAYPRRRHPGLEPGP